MKRKGISIRQKYSMKYTYLYILLILCGMPFTQINGQDLSNIGEKDPLKISGGISANQVYYGSNSSVSSRDPYSYYLTGRLNLALYGWNIPFSYRYSNQNRAFQQPFNQFSLSPRYKWIQAHIGYSSMSFSPYTMSGHLFYGLGLEVRPSKEYEIAVLYGRLKRATTRDTLNPNVEPSYRRMGYGLKATLHKWNGTYEITFFRSKDDMNSLDSIPAGAEVLPEQNLVVSFKAQKAILQSLSLAFEYAGSGLTEDLRANTSGVSAPSIFEHSGSLFTPRQSSSYFDAMNMSLNYQFKTTGLALRYERVDPGYRTHGAYYFNNDMENITVNANSALFEQKIHLGFNLGLQRNNLDDQKASSMNRMVSSVNVGIRPSKKMNVNLSYSNFQSHTHVRTKFEELNRLSPYENLDTLNFTQISQNASANVTYRLPGEGNTSRQISVNGSWQKAASRQSDMEEHSGSQFYSLNTAYSHSVKSIGLSLTAAINMNHSNSDNMRSSIFGPTASVSKTFFDRALRSAFSVSYNNSYAGSDLNTSVLNARLNNNFTWKKKHRVGLSLTYMNRSAQLSDQNTLSEFTLRMNYGYSFGR